MDALWELASSHPWLSAGCALGTCVVLATLQLDKQWKTRHIPGTWQVPILGDIPAMEAEDTTGFLDKRFKRWEDSRAYTWWLGPQQAITITDPDLAKRVLSKSTRRANLDMLTFKTGYDYMVWKSFLINTWGKKWHMGRRATEASIMHHKALRTQAPSIAQCVDRLCVVLDRYAKSGEPVDILECAYALAMDAIGWAGFGVDLHTTTGLVNDHVSKQTPGTDGDAEVFVSSGSTAKAADTRSQSASLGQVPQGEWWKEYPVGSPEFGRCLVQCAVVNMKSYELTEATVYTPLALLMPSLYPLWSLLSKIFPDQKLAKERQALQGLKNGCKAIMEAWKQQQLSKKIDATQDSGSVAVSEDGLMARLMSGAEFEYNESLEEHEILGVAITAIIGGYDTTGTGISMTLWRLAKHPEVQAKVQQELDTVLQGKSVTVDDLDQLPYLYAVVQESIRLNPPAASAVREIVGEDIDGGDGLILPKGSWVIMPTYSYHTSDKLWPRALEFLPERFLPDHDHLKPTTPNAYMPFGAGARMCVGYKFAQMEMQLAVGRLMQRYTVSTVAGVPDPKQVTGMTYAPKQVVLQVQHRKQ